MDKSEKSTHDEVSAIKKLWMETFHDSREYVDLLFDRYGDTMKTATEYDGDRLVASLVGIPYMFESSDMYIPPLRGLYLCGLATERKHRNRGIMTRLIENICGNAREDDFDFMFLIPADEGLRRYYADRGFVSSFYKNRQRFVAGYDFSKFIHAESSEDILESSADTHPIVSGDISVNISDDTVDYDVDNRYLSIRELTGDNDASEEDKISYIAKCMSALEYVMLSENNSCNSFSIIHDYDDWKTIIKERIISDDYLFISQKRNAVNAAAFARVVDGEISIDRLMYDADYNAICLLDYISGSHPDKPLNIVSDYVFPDRTISLWKPYNSRESAAMADNVAEEGEMPFDVSLLQFSFGMIRLLDSGKFLQKLHLDYPESFSDRDVASALFRPPVSGTQPDYVGMACGLPRLDIHMALMLE